MYSRSDPEIRMRPATPGDAADLVVLVDIASRGLLSWLWTEMAAPGQSPLDFGRQRILTNSDLPSHYLNWEVAIVDDEIAGGMAGYRVPKPYEPGDIDGLPELYAPLLELERLAAGTWHLMSVAVYPQFRNKGIGKRLIDRAEQLAAKAKCDVVSIIANSANDGACRLYRDQDYHVRECRDYIPFPGSKDSGQWILFQKSI